MKFPVYTIQSYLWDKIYTQQLIRALFSLFGVYHLPSGNELQSQGDKHWTGENREQAGACRGTERIAWECFTAFIFMAEIKWPRKRLCLNPGREEIVSAVLTPASDLPVHTKYFLCIHWLRKREHRGLVFQCIVGGFKHVIHPDSGSNIARSTYSSTVFAGMPWLHLRLAVPVLFPGRCAVAKRAFSGPLLLLFTLT